MIQPKRRQERDWPTLPVPFFGFRIIYEELARIEWDSSLGALPPFEFADRGKIAAALALPFQTSDGHELFPTVPGKAAAMFRLKSNSRSSGSPGGRSNVAR